MHHSAHQIVHQPLCNPAPGRQPKGASQLDCCACLPYRLRYELLERRAKRAQALLHGIELTQHSTQQANVRLYTFGLAANFPRCGDGNLASYLPNDMSPDPAKSRAHQQCMPDLPSASLCAPSQPAIVNQTSLVDFTAGALHQFQVRG